MDPNATLDALRDAASRYEDTRGAGNPLNAEAEQAADDMRDAIRALDDWLSAGGFLPADWCGFGAA